MLRIFTGMVLCLSLASCGSSNSDGSVASGPLGQRPLLTQDVQFATRMGLNACLDALSTGRSLSSLQASGFAAWRNGYRIRIDNPLIFAGNSSVVAKLTRSDCRVTTGPAYPIEVQTVMSLTKDVLGQRFSQRNAQFRKAGDKIEIILK